MAIQARFGADFTAFQDAVRKAEIQLKEFETGAGKVQTSLGSLADKFSGRKLIQEAVLMAEAVQRVGGISTLTSNELQKLGAQAQEAAEKFRALGQDVPQNIQAVADAAKKASASVVETGTHTNALTGYFQDLGKNILSTAAGFVSAQAVIQTFKVVITDLIGGTIQYADHLDDLAKATGITATGLQQLGFAGQRVGVNLDDIANLVAQLSKRLATGDGNAVSAVRQLGLSLDSLKGLAPQELFVQLAEAVGNVADPLAQAAVGSELFGRKFQDVMRLTKDGLRATMDQANEFGAVMSEDNVKKLSAFNDKIGDLSTKLKVLASEALTPVVDLLTRFMNLGQKNVTITFIDPKAEGELKKFGLALGVVEAAGPGLMPTGIGLKVVGQAAEDLAKGGTTLTTSLEMVRNELNAMRTAAMQPLSKEQQKLIQDLKEWGKGEDEIAKKVGASVEAVHRYVKALEDSKKAQEDAARAAKKQAEDSAATAAKVKELELGYRGIAPAVEKIGTIYEPVSKTVSEGNRAMLLSLEQVEGKANEFGIVTYGIGTTIERMGRMAVEAVPKIRQLGEAFTEWVANVATELSRLPELIGQALTGGGGFSGAFQALGSNIGSTLFAAGGPLNTVGNKLTEWAGSLGNHVQNIIGSILPGIGSLIGPAIGGIINLFRGSEESRMVNQPREQYVQAAGGLAQLNAKAMAATGSLQIVKDLLNAKTAADYEKAVNAINKAFDEFKQKSAAAHTTLDGINTRFSKLVTLTPELQAALDKTFDANNIDDYIKGLEGITGVLDTQEKQHQHLIDLMGEYGLKASGASKEFQQGESDRSAQKLIADFRELSAIFPNLNNLMGTGMSEAIAAAGGNSEALAKVFSDLSSITGGMGANVEAFYLAAKKAGLEVPEEMKKVIQTAIDSGQLFDENGKKITDMKDTGLIFGESMQKTTKDLQEVMLKLAYIIDTKIGGAFDSAANTASEAAERAYKAWKEKNFGEFLPTGEGGAVPAPAGASTGGVVLPFGVRGFARGGWSGSDTVPALLTPGELILNKQQQARLFGGGGSEVVRLEIPVIMDGREVSRIVIADLDQELRKRRRLRAA